MARLPDRLRRTLRRTLRPAAYVGSFVLLPVAVGGATILSKMGRMSTTVPPALAEAAPAPPQHDPDRLTAVIVAGNHNTESTDLLAPYEVLAASGAFNVYTVAPERQVAPLFPGTLDILPHYSFAGFDAVFGTPPDLLVVPYIPGSEGVDRAVLGWIREHAGPRTTVLTICGGSLVLAQTGLLDGRRATSHQSVLRIAPGAHPEVRWVSGLRYVEDGNIISSAGVTSGIDATLFTLQRMLGREAAVEVARELGYPHLAYLDDPAFEVPRGYGLAAYLSGAFRWRTAAIGLALGEGVGEIELASILDTYPRSYAAEVHTLAPERTVIRSRHGLDLVPRRTFADAPPLDRLLVAGTRAPGTLTGLAAWAEQRGLAVEQVHGGDFAYDDALRDMALHESAALAGAAASGLEYPAPELGGGPVPAAGLLFTPVALGILGLVAVAAVDRRRSRTSIPPAERR
jgi:putative intracellular protease/amidase